MTESRIAMPRGRSTPAAQVLLIEDSPGDARLTREALKDADASVGLHVAADGVDGLAFLKRESPHDAVPRPDLILLDLNLPRMDGRELLTLIKADEGLKTIPVVVLTASEAAVDINRCHELNASCYLCKPMDLTAFWDLVQSIHTFWLGLAKLPPQAPSG